MKTAIEELIEELYDSTEQERDVLSQENLYHPNDVKQARLVFSTIKNVIIKCKEKLPIEKQQIVDAHTAGMIIALKTGDDEDFRLSFNECAEQYYQNTFKK